jgi:hypothetical protein
LFASARIIPLFFINSVVTTENKKGGYTYDQYNDNGLHDLTFLFTAVRPTFLPSLKFQGNTILSRNACRYWMPGARCWIKEMVMKIRLQESTEYLTVSAQPHFFSPVFLRLTFAEGAVDEPA